jgi:uncharacterized protein
MIKRIFIISILPLLILISSCQKQAEDIKIDTSEQKNAEKIKFTKMGEVFFQDSAKSLKKKIDVEIAETDDTRHRGLMFRESMLEDQGMLFIFTDEEEQSFYMKNTVIPLDILFVNSKKVIVKIHKNAKPFDETSLPSRKPSIYVVEVNGGFCDKFAIKEGDHIDFRRN